MQAREEQAGREEGVLAYEAVHQPTRLSEREPILHPGTGGPHVKGAGKRHPGGKSHPNGKMSERRENQAKGGG